MSHRLDGPGNTLPDLCFSETDEILPAERAHHILQGVRDAELGDTVLIVESPDTIAGGYAGRSGTCYGFTTPSVTGVDVVGEPVDDHAFNVGFDDGTSAWFQPSLVAVVDVNAGQVAVVGDKRFVRAPNGDWMEAPD